MAVTISASNQRNASQNNTYSYAHVGNTLVLAAIGSDGGGKPTVSTVTFNGAAPSQTLYSAQTGGAATTGCSLFVWEGLSDVTANIVINFSRATAGGLMAVSLSGAPTSSVVDTNNIATGNGTSASVSLTSVDSGSLVLDFIGVQGNVASTLAENGLQTEWGTPTFPGSWTTHSASSKSSSGSVSMDWTWTGAQNYSLMSVAILSAVAGLSITSVDTDNAVLAGQSQATFAGTGLASTAKFAVKRGSAIAYATDISLSGSTGGSFTAPTMTAMFSAGVRFGDVAFYAAETSGTAIASISGSITTATNWKYVNVTDLSATGSMGSLFYNNAVSLSDQVAYSSVTTRFRWPVTVSGDGYFTVNSSGSQAGDEFAYRIWDETDSTWGTEGTIEVNGGISSAEQVYAAGSLVQASLESSTLEGATLQ